MRAAVMTMTLAGLAGAAVADNLNLNVAQAMAASATAAEGTGSFWDGWKRNVEIGLNGATGNTENFNARGALGAVRDVSDMTTSIGVFYIYGTNDSVKNKSRGEFNIRNDWKLQEPWGFFATFKAEYDEFQPWQWRLSGFLGPSYNFIKNDTTLLKGRLGFGASYEMGKQAKEKLIPELDIGLDWSHKLNDRARVFASLDYYPSLDRFPEYRAAASAGVEVTVDPATNMLLKAGIQDRYDHRAKSPVKKNDLDFFLTLAWAI